MGPYQVLPFRLSMDLLSNDNKGVLQRTGASPSEKILLLPRGWSLTIRRRTPYSSRLKPHHKKGCSSFPEAGASPSEEVLLIPQGWSLTIRRGTPHPPRLKPHHQKEYSSFPNAGASRSASLTRYDYDWLKNCLHNILGGKRFLKFWSFEFFAASQTLTSTSFLKVVK